MATNMPPVHAVDGLCGRPPPSDVHEASSKGRPSPLRRPPRRTAGFPGRRRRAASGWRPGTTDPPSPSRRRAASPPGPPRSASRAGVGLPATSPAWCPTAVVEQAPSWPLATGAIRRVVSEISSSEHKNHYRTVWFPAGNRAKMLPPNLVRRADGRLLRPHACGQIAHDGPCQRADNLTVPRTIPGGGHIRTRARCHASRATRVAFRRRRLTGNQAAAIVAGGVAASRSTASLPSRPSDHRSGGSRS